MLNLIMLEEIIRDEDSVDFFETFHMYKIDIFKKERDKIF